MATFGVQEEGGTKTPAGGPERTRQAEEEAGYESETNSEAFDDNGDKELQEAIMNSMKP